MNRRDFFRGIPAALAMIGGARQAAATEAERPSRIEFVPDAPQARESALSQQKIAALVQDELASFFDEYSR